MRSPWAVLEMSLSFHMQILFWWFRCKGIMGISKTKPRMRHLINVKKPHPWFCLRNPHDPFAAKSSKQYLQMETQRLLKHCSWTSHGLLMDLSMTALGFLRTIPVLWAMIYVSLNPYRSGGQIHWSFILKGEGIRESKRLPFPGFIFKTDQRTVPWSTE